MESAEDPHSLPRAIARVVGAEWIAVRHGGGDWTPSAVRRIDFGLLRRLPRNRLVRLSGPALARSPRLSAAGLTELLVFLSTDAAVVIALARPLRVDRDDLEAMLSAWAGTMALRSRLACAEERIGRHDREARAACALHDLRHELTVASLELERVSTEAPPASRAGLERLQAAIAGARELCETELRSPERGLPSPVKIDEILRTEAHAAQVVSGRVESIGVEIRCPQTLEFTVESEPLSRIVRNLVLNAIENSPDGETVRIEAERGPGARFVLRVIDRGRGMPSAGRDELMRFGRSGRGGFGIGSASVASCARRIGARMEVSSRLGAGTCVELTLS